jgi:hypothetical protein
VELYNCLSICLHGLYREKFNFTLPISVILESFKKTEKLIGQINVWSIALYGAETWTLRKVDQKYLESIEIWCWRRKEKISWTDCVRNEEVLHRVKEERNVVHTVKR